MKNFIKVALLALVSTIAIKLNEYILDKKLLDELYSIIISSSVAMIIYKSLEFILLEKLINFKWLRYFMDPSSRFEGKYIEKLDRIEERPYSFASIEYNPHSQSYVYSGFGYDTEGNKKCHWHSSKLEIDFKKEEIIFFFEAQLIDEESEVIKGYGTINFEKDMRGKYTRGKGFFVDSGTNFIKCNFVFDRVTKCDINNLIGKKNISTNDDMKQFIQKFHEQREESRLSSNKADNDEDLYRG